MLLVRITTRCIESFSCVFLRSDYQYNTTAMDMTADVVSAPLGPDAIKAIWLLFLALIFKMIITIFTFGLKVSIELSLLLIDFIEIRA